MVDKTQLNNLLPDSPASEHLLMLCDDCNMNLDDCELIPNDFGRNYLRVLAALNEFTDDESFHLSSRRMLPGTTRFILNNLHNCLSLKALLCQLASGFNFVHGGNYNFVKFKETSVAYVVDDKDFNYNPGSNPTTICMMLDTALMMVHGIVKSCCPEARLVGIDSKSSPGSILHWLQPVNLLNHKVTSFGLFYDAQCLDYKVNARVLGQISMTELALSSYEYDGCFDTKSLREKVAELLKSGLFDQQTVASRMHMSVATLRRKLREENISFRELCEQSKNKLAKRLLQNNATLDEICDYLGFADERSFNRAFKHWNGITPLAFRATL